MNTKDPKAYGESEAAEAALLPITRRWIERAVIVLICVRLRARPILMAAWVSASNGAQYR